MRRLLSATIFAAALFLPIAPATLVAQSTDVPLTTRTFVDVAKRTLPSVVSIAIRTRELDTAFDPTNPMFEDMMKFFSRNGRNVNPDRFIGSQGSGFIMRVDGRTAYVLTNNHVIARARTEGDISIRLDPSIPPGEGTRVRDGSVEIDFGTVSIVGRDSLSDLAVLKFEIPEGVNVQPLDFANSDAVEVGEWVVALGNPLEFNNSVSQGIVSAKGRLLESNITIQSLVQTTAAINPGNSGGPLVNLSGDVVGVNNAIASNNGLWQGVGFAIPSNDALRIGKQLLDAGSVKRGYLGIQMAPLSAAPHLAAKYDISEYEGVVVEMVVPDTPAAAAGLNPGDVIVSANGKSVREPDELLRTIARTSAGDRLELTVRRLDEGGKPVTETVSPTLMERPSDEKIASTQRGPRREAPSIVVPELSDANSFGIEVREAAGGRGLEVRSLEEDSPAARAGLREGDVLQRVNGKRVYRPDDLANAIKLSGDGSHMLTFSRDGKTLYATLKE